VQKGGPILPIYTSYDMFLRKKLRSGGRDDCTRALKLLVALISFNHD